MPATKAQPAAKVPRVGVLHPGPAPGAAGGALARFRQGLRELGYVEGQTIVLEVRFDDHLPQRMTDQAAELVRQPVDVIVAGTTPSAQAAKLLTNTIPIVMAVSADPVADGLVASLARPDGNVTGLSIMTPEVTGQRLQLLSVIVPNLSRVALLLDTGNPRWPSDLKEHEAAASSLGLQLVPIKVGGPDEFANAIRAAQRGDAQALILAQSSQFAMHWKQLAALALSHRLPTMAGSGDGQFARAGGLMNYGVNIGASWQRAATYVHRILNGAKPGDLPVEQPNRFELVINRRTAEALGIVLPPHLMFLADEVIR